MREVVADCLVEVLAADAAHEAAVLHDEDAALAVPLAERHRVPDGRARLDRSRRGRHDVPRRAVAAGGLCEDVEHAAARGLEVGTRDRRRRLRVATATERSRDGGRVERLRTTPNDDEHALVHLDEQHERTRVREVDDLVREVRHAVDVLGPLQRSDEDLLAVRDDRLQALHQGLEQLPLTRSERRVQVLVHELLARAVADAPRQGVDVALRRRRVRQRARVLVDAESERRRLERRRLQLALRDDADERRRERAVGREHAASADTQSGTSCSPWWSKSTVSTSGSSATASSSPRRDALATSTTISRRIASSSRRLTSAIAPSSSACSR